jgi:adenosylhomocysteine nucleosidase
MQTIGIIAALPQEREACLRFIRKSQRSLTGPFRCDRFRLNGRDCWLITSGMGLKRAEQAARALLRVTSLQLLVSVGVAGAVNADLDIGDVVISTNAFLLDQGLPVSFQPLALLSEAAWQAAVKALQPRRARLFYGTAVTSHGAQFIKHQPEQIITPVLEMETVGIAQVAAEKGIPLLSLRAISDGPRAPLPFNLEAVMDEDYNLRIGKIFKSILFHPRILLKLMLLGTNTRLAAVNAATALIAALSQTDALLFQR